MLRAITFDFWGTLYDNRNLYPQRIERFYRKLRAAGVDFDEAALEAAMKAGSLAGRRAWLEESRSFSARERLSYTFAQAGIQLAKPVLDDLVLVWENALLDSPPRLLDGVVEALTQADNAGLALAVISDTGTTPGRVLRQVLQADGLLSLFSFCAFSDEIGRTKPHLRPFQETLAALGDIDPAAAVHIGDLPFTDVRGARQVGMKAVQYTGVRPAKPDDSDEPDALLASWADLPAVLNRVSGKRIGYV